MLLQIVEIAPVVYDGRLRALGAALYWMLQRAGDLKVQLRTPRTPSNAHRAHRAALSKDRVGVAAAMAAVIDVCMLTGCRFFRPIHIIKTNPLPSAQRRTQRKAS